MSSVMEDKNSLLGSKKSKARKELRDKIATELFKTEEGNANTYTNLLILSAIIIST